MNEEELEQLRHKNRMEELEFERKAKLEVEKVKHEDELACIRLKNANIRRTIQEKQWR